MNQADDLDVVVGNEQADRGVDSPAGLAPCGGYTSKKDFALFFFPGFHLGRAYQHRLEEQETSLT